MVTESQFQNIEQHSSEWSTNEPHSHDEFFQTTPSKSTHFKTPKKKYKNRSNNHSSFKSSPSSFHSTSYRSHQTYTKTHTKTHTKPHTHTNTTNNVYHTSPRKQQPSNYYTSFNNRFKHTKKQQPSYSSHTNPYNNHLHSIYLSHNKGTPYNQSYESTQSIYDYQTNHSNTPSSQYQTSPSHTNTQNENNNSNTTNWNNESWKHQTHSCKNNRTIPYQPPNTRYSKKYIPRKNDHHVEIVSVRGLNELSRNQESMHTDDQISFSNILDQKYDTHLYYMCKDGYFVYDSERRFEECSTRQKDLISLKKNNNNNKSNVKDTLLNRIKYTKDYPSCQLFFRYPLGQNKDPKTKRLRPKSFIKRLRPYFIEQIPEVEKDASHNESPFAKPSWYKNASLDYLWSRETKERSTSSDVFYPSGCLALKEDQSIISFDVDTGRTNLLIHPKQDTQTPYKNYHLDQMEIISDNKVVALYQAPHRNDSNGSKTRAMSILKCWDLETKQVKDEFQQCNYRLTSICSLAPNDSHTVICGSSSYTSPISILYIDRDFSNNSQTASTYITPDRSYTRGVPKYRSFIDQLSYNQICPDFLKFNHATSTLIAASKQNQQYIFVGDKHAKELLAKIELHIHPISTTVSNTVDNSSSSSYTNSKTSSSCPNLVFSPFDLARNSPYGISAVSTGNSYSSGIGSNDFYVFVGMNNGYVQVYDLRKMKHVETFTLNEFRFPIVDFSFDNYNSKLYGLQYSYESYERHCEIIEREGDEDIDTGFDKWNVDRETPNSVMTQIKLEAPVEKVEKWNSYGGRRETERKVLKSIVKYRNLVVEKKTKIVDIEVLPKKRVFGKNLEWDIYVEKDTREDVVGLVKRDLNYSLSCFTRNLLSLCVFYTDKDLVLNLDSNNIKKEKRNKKGTGKKGDFEI